MLKNQVALSIFILYPCTIPPVTINHLLRASLRWATGCDLFFLIYHWYWNIFTFIFLFNIDYLSIFFVPCIDRSGAYSFFLDCFLVVLLFVRKNFYIGHSFWLVRVKAIIFHMSIPCYKIFLLVPSSRSSVKVTVKYQGHSFRKNGHSRGIGVSQTHCVFSSTGQRPARYCHGIVSVMCLSVHSSVRLPSKNFSSETIDWIFTKFRRNVS